VQRVRACGEGLVEDAVTADSVDGAAGVLHARVHEHLADRCGVVGCLRVDDHVWVDGVRPGGAAMVEPAAEGAVAEVAEALAATDEGDATVGEVEVGEFQAADGTGAGGVLGGQGDDDPRGRVGGQLLAA
jgi:hypothetical protein